MLEFLSQNMAQVMGFLALIVSVVGFQFNNRTVILNLKSIAQILWSIHFYLLGAFTGSVIVLLAIFRNYWFIKFREKYDYAWVPLIFIGVFAVISIITWQGLVSILPLAGVTVGTIAFWQQKPRSIRRISLLIPPLWFCYDLLNSSYAGMIIETFVFGSICLAILRYDILGKKESSKMLEKLEVHH